MNKQTVKIFNTHADLCKVIANPKRLMIIDLLSRQEMCVGDLARALETASSTVSQHLRLLRDKDVVGARKEGQTTYYRLTTPRMVKACRLIREILLSEMKKRGEIAEDLQAEDLLRIPK